MKTNKEKFEILKEMLFEFVETNKGVALISGINCYGKIADDILFEFSKVSFWFEGSVECYSVISDIEIQEEEDGNICIILK